MEKNLISVKNKTNLLKFSIFFIILLSSPLFTSCAVPDFAKPSKVSKNVPINAKERARKNVEQGRGASLKGMIGGGSRSTNYEFSTSNPMWRASLEILDFLPFSTVDYSGGMIITDWYSQNNSNDAIKITVRFLANEVRSDSLKISVHKKECKSNMNCRTNLLKNSAIGNELRTSIIRKAAILERESKDKKKK